MTKISATMATRAAAQQAAPTSVNNAAKMATATMINSVLDRDGYRKRFEDLLGKRTPQFVSSIVTMINASQQLQQAFVDAPATVVQSALKAATFDLPIDTTLGYAYIVPFRNGGKMEAQFIMGYKGMIQLALRTGVYKVINVSDVKEGELRKFNRLTEDIELEFIEDEDERDALPTIGWVGYFRMINGTEKTIYMTRSQIEAHERKHRKGAVPGFGWRNNFEAMARKTVLRKLIGTWGLMSIDYQRADMATVAYADALAKGKLDDQDDSEQAIDGEFTFNDEDAALVAELDKEQADAAAAEAEEV